MLMLRFQPAVSLVFDSLLLKAVQEYMPRYRNLTLVSVRQARVPPPSTAAFITGSYKSEALTKDP